MSTDDFYKMMRKRRFIMRISQGEAAARAGISREAYNAIENGRRNPTLSTTLSILEALELEITFYQE